MSLIKSKSRSWDATREGYESFSYVWRSTTTGEPLINQGTYNLRTTCTQKTAWEQTFWPQSQRLIRNAKRRGDKYIVDLWEKADIGGDFQSETTTYEEYAEKVYTNFRINSGSAYFIINGHLKPRTGTGSGLTIAQGTNWPTVSADDLLRLSSAGTTAIARCAPTKSNADLAQFTGELLRDGLPNLVGVTLLRDRCHFFKSLGSEYLNVEFGWKPFISDFRKLLKSVSEYEKILGQYKRDSGKLVRRSYSFPTIQENGPLYDQMVQVNPASQSSMFADPNGLARQIGYRTYTKKIWFSGAFQYWLASGSNNLSAIQRKAQEANHLLGIRLTPDVLWELEPWSWFVDWFTNMGDVFANLSRGQTDSQVMRYGYVMGDYHIRDEHSSYGLLWKNGQRSGLSSFTRGNRVKIRTKATPFGFGLDPATDFTARQWAIIGALGLSRGDRVAW